MVSKSYLHSLFHARRYIVDFGGLAAARLHMHRHPPHSAYTPPRLLCSASAASVAAKQVRLRSFKQSPSNRSIISDVLMGDGHPARFQWRQPPARKLAWHQRTPHGPGRPCALAGSCVPAGRSSVSSRGHTPSGPPLRMNDVGLSSAHLPSQPRPPTNSPRTAVFSHSCALARQPDKLTDN